MLFSRIFVVLVVLVPLLLVALDRLRVDVAALLIAALLGLPGADPRFTTLDQRVYRPLCLGLAALVGSSLVAGDDQVQVR